VISKIISGGQTGADRAALDAAINLGLPHGGWIPKGRLTEEGPLPEKYNLQEMPTPSYPKRTEQNVIDSNGTLILSYGKLTGGSKLTQEFAENHKKPCLHIDLSKEIIHGAAIVITDWIQEHDIKVLNVAGPKASKDPEIYTEVLSTIELVVYMQRSVENTEIIKQTSVVKTVSEAVDLLIKLLPLKDRTTVANMTIGELISLNPTLGAYIRNKFGLIAGNKELLESCRWWSKDQSMLPEQAPMVIIKELWQQLRKTHKLRVVK
jgi:hypothetical protein